MEVSTLVGEVSTLVGPDEMAEWVDETRPALDQGATAPSRMESEASGTTRSSSNSSKTPRPSQVPQAPWGELKEKLLGLTSGSDILQ